MKKKLRNIVLILLILIFLTSGTLLLRDLLRRRGEDNANRDIAAQVHEIEAAIAANAASSSASSASAHTASAALADAEAEGSRYADSGNLLQYDALWQRNNDLAGWLRIEDTKIDYPVVYTPESQNYYLRKAFDGSYAISGTLFLAHPWNETTNHAIIYGHRMNDGTMFGGLRLYADEAYGQAHRLIRFDTLTETNEYELVAAFYSRVYEMSNEDDGRFRYYLYANLEDEELYSYYVAQVKAASLYDTGITPVYGERLLTLSTCDYYTNNGRFVVVARIVQPETAPDADAGPEDEAPAEGAENAPDGDTGA